jgi:hypothetical protein
MKKIGLLCLALVLALGTLGIGYAHWCDTIYIEGQVTTGELCVEFVNCDLMDDEEPVNYGGDYPTDDPDNTSNNGFVFEPGKGYWWELDKNVGWGTQNISDDGMWGGKTLTVTLNNVYPSYFNELTFYLHNCGTIPLKIDHIVINGQNYTGGVPYVQFDFNGDGAYDFEIQWGNNWGEQLEPCSASPEFSFWMHVLQPCPQAQLDTLTFTICIVVVQWNGYPLVDDLG